MFAGRATRARRTRPRRGQHLPRLLLAYLALQDRNSVKLRNYVDQLQKIALKNYEVIALDAALHALTKDIKQAQEIIDQPMPGALSSSCDE